MKYKMNTLHLLFITSHVLSSIRALSTSTHKLVWFRDHALRIQDNEALHTAIAETDENGSIQPFYLWQSSAKDATYPNPINTQTGGTARDVFTATALKSLNQTFHGNLAVGLLDSSPDECQATSIAKELVHICKSSNLNEIFYQRSYNDEVENAIAKELEKNGIDARVFSSYTLLDYENRQVPWEKIVLDDPWRSPLIPYVEYVQDTIEEEGLKPVLEIDDCSLKKASCADISLTCPCDVDELNEKVGITPGNTEWGKSIVKEWPADEISAQKALTNFLESLEQKEDDDAKKTTHLASLLSPYLARGLISPKQVYSGIISVVKERDVGSIVRRICWRDYAYAVAKLFPNVVKGEPIRDGYDAVNDGVDLEEEEQQKRLDSWKEGRTGFPLVDSGMRELVATGYMPQKVRLACSTFLVEGLGLPWRAGMQHFAEFLVDYDEVINSNMWQNSACVGLDPYYMGMNYKRRQYWDKEGDYVRKWCPELTSLPDSVDIEVGKTTKTIDCLYEPWACPPEILEKCEIELGVTYPERICDERQTRSDYFAKIRMERSKWPATKIDDKKRDFVQLGDIARIGMFTPRAIQLKRIRD